MHILDFRTDTAILGHSDLLDREEHQGLDIIVGLLSISLDSVPDMGLFSIQHRVSI